MSKYSYILAGTAAFEISNKAEPQTIGVWIYPKQLPDGRILLVIDSEGISPSSPSTLSSSPLVKLLSLVALLACDGGVLIDLEMREFGGHTLQSLEQMAKIKQIIRGLDSKRYEYQSSRCAHVLTVLLVGPLCLYYYGIFNKALL